MCPMTTNEETLVVEERELTVFEPTSGDRTRILDDVEVTRAEDLALYTFHRPVTLGHTT